MRVLDSEYRTLAVLATHASCTVRVHALYVCVLALYCACHQYSIVGPDFSGQLGTFVEAVGFLPTISVLQYFEPVRCAFSSSTSQRKQLHPSGIHHLLAFVTSSNQQKLCQL